ncbi:Uroporphyrin-III C/tetrapyrrole (Corrin/Porphyrin) methyltransferase [Rippkaea orientalis PCC 8801]|uniref:Ribosomal RNA small subunit methyltransferase I n=1 Tax=Rippkaea orientalis (strain PCC 8801 / RF-1) TaxID=41431 RepID=B7JZH0_RIPO1|nr:16S rRNA (cytidine(1402)-2'-O)-methyltransferase [Rippkaea orientalis]ACK64130.1 Uroporphyrin-III C/tetrapyrrole (Corrin/Porphyrin) methyltransferase [Rippkaea orientalis PCC 8801]
MSNKSLQKGTLYVVGTPIGNLEDITLRAIRILQSVDVIAAEDTRHTGKLLHHFQINTPQLSYHQHSELTRQERLISQLQEGQTIALVTDAGMPGISDPGYELIKACIEQNIPVVPIPGVTAAITALSVSGLPTDHFVFEGFLPTKGKLRRDRLTHLSTETRTLIFYESPHRLLQTLTDLVEVLGQNRLITVGRELTKFYEELWRGTLQEAMIYYQDSRQLKGEFTLIVAGCSQMSDLDLTEDQLKKELQQLLSQGMTRSQASKQLSQLTSLNRRQIYELSLDINDLLKD